MFTWKKNCMIILLIENERKNWMNILLVEKERKIIIHLPKIFSLKSTQNDNAVKNTIPPKRD